MHVFVLLFPLFRHHRECTVGGIMGIAHGGSLIVLSDSDGVYSDRSHRTQATNQNFPSAAAQRKKQYHIFSPTPTLMLISLSP